MTKNIEKNAEKKENGKKGDYCKVSEVDEEWKELPTFGTIQRLPISAAIPYNFRWRINEIKLMLNDLAEIAKKHEIPTATILYETVRKEATDLMLQLNKHIEEVKAKRQELTK